MKSTRNQYRIIAGQWRSRPLAFPDGEGLRPTGGRIRETLFNWLRDALPGARCLDLFAGSGALGFEALSRGARAVTAVEKARPAAQALQRNAQLLDAAGYQPLHTDALQWLAAGSREAPYDIAFLDPPYQSRCLDRCCRLLEQGGWLAPAALIYLEDDAPLDGLRLPDKWTLEKHKKAGQVHYGLCRRQ